MTRPHIFIIIGDCLRAASATEETMPFTTSFADFNFEQCYAPSTWTLPSHASLYSQQTPIEHGVSRRGTSLGASQAVLPKIAHENGYQTGLFSENPTFSTHLGFDDGIDFVDDFINSKRFISDFSTEAVVEGVSISDGIRVLDEVRSRPNKIKNLLNALYGPFSYAIGSDTTYPHHGKRVCDHVISYSKNNQTKQLFSFINLLDPHNPHHAPPKRAARDVELAVPQNEREALWAASDNKEYLLADPNDLPAGVRRHFDSWDAVFTRQEEIYRTQVRYFDMLVENWVAEMSDNLLRDSLIIVTGDHGQLFGVEGMVGHHTSLHPHGVQVPLFVSTPESWGTQKTGNATPVSWLGLSQTLGEVACGDITDPLGFNDRLTETSTGPDGVVITVDGPTWNVSELRKEYNDDQVDTLAIRKVGLVWDDRMDVFASPWKDESITHTAYDLHNDTRTEISDANEPALATEYECWLLNQPDDEISATVSNRLKQLGYV